jgi:hypothetical protein
MNRWSAKNARDQWKQATKAQPEISTTDAIDKETSFQEAQRTMAPRVALVLRH